MLEPITEPVQPIGLETQAYIERHRPVLTREQIDREVAERLAHSWHEYKLRVEAVRRWAWTELLRAGAGE